MKFILCNNCRQTVELHLKDKMMKCPNCGHDLKHKQILKNSGLQKLKTPGRPKA